jgi:hypothetical protein
MGQDSFIQGTHPWNVHRGGEDVSPTDVSPTESSWMLRPLNKASLGYYALDRCVPTLDRATHGSHKAGSTAAICLPIGYR